MLYEYKCLECNTRYPKRHGINLKPSFKCEADTCNGVLTRVPVLTQFAIKGDSSQNEWGNKPQRMSGKDFNDSLSE